MTSWTTEGDSTDEKPVPEPTFEREVFLAYRSARRGTANPERMNNPVWEWLIASGISAWQANQRFSAPIGTDVVPGWCFQRFGQTSTILSDGCEILIGGEHEDYYDPDFHIYNDVVVKHPDGRVEIFGYPEENFPPTDFHTATVVGNRIVLVGRLGYQDKRISGTTPVLELAIGSWRICARATTGQGPGWLFEHETVLSEEGRSLLVRGGKIDSCEKGGTLVENLDEWRLDLDEWRWERTLHRPWRRWELRRKDPGSNRLWEMRQAAWYQSVGWKDGFEKILRELVAVFGSPPDLALLEHLYRPDGVTHVPLPKGPDEHNVHRIQISDTVVRYVEDSHTVQMTVEGQLPESVLEQLLTDLERKLATLERCPYVGRPL